MGQLSASFESNSFTPAQNTTLAKAVEESQREDFGFRKSRDHINPICRLEWAF